MLPSLVSQELKHSVNRFLQTTFPSASAGFQRTDAKGLEEQTIDELLQTAEQLFKGPYLSLGLPFRTANSDVKLPFEVLNPGYLPYSHQLAAYKRLCGESPQSTLIATGTGSGKTECFMYPLLDHCAQHQGPGIKAIIVYPMNALATDQARRFAKEIHSTDALRGKVRVGLFVGDSEQSPDRSMSETSVITSKDTLRDDPPDILLTNYKMLDYLLIRPKDRPLWRFNTPGMLRYLVVDELHTFDGAQGTDLACLIRRIRDRLQIGAEMACVGTSATIGGESSVQALLAYARKVFATELDDKAVIREDRLSAEEFLAEHPVLYTSWPEDSTLLQMSPDNYHSIADYVSAHARLWFDEPPQGLKSSNPTTRQNACVALAQLLRQHAAVHKLLQDVQGISNTEVLAANWAARRRTSTDGAAATLDSLCALIAAARDWRLLDDSSQGTKPFLQLRSQLWLRETRRMVASVGEHPTLTFDDDLAVKTDPVHLPVLHCRECHATAWISKLKPNEMALEHDIRVIYNAYFGGSADTCVMFPLGDEQPPAEPKGRVQRVCNDCGRLTNAKAEGDWQCPSCEKHDSVRVWLPYMVKEKNDRPAEFVPDCPYCNSNKSLSILGSKAASLSSVMISGLFGSNFNDDHKLIAFSDSVQDAAHRAGFFAARTWRQVMRDATAQAIHTDFDNMPLDKVVQQLPLHWLATLGQEAFVATFIAPNLEWLRDWEELKVNGALPKDSRVAKEWIAKRFSWEVLREFSLGSRIGRTLERSGRATIGPDLHAVERATATALRRLSAELAECRDLDHATLMHFILGMLWHMRSKGAFYDKVLESYLYEGGNQFLLNRNKFMPGFGKAAASPAFLSVEKVSKNFETIKSKHSNWYTHWLHKTLAQDSDVLMSASLEQSYRIVLAALVQEDLLQEHEVKDRTVWSLQQSKWHCSSQLVEFRCSDCRNAIQLPKSQQQAWSGLSCLRSSCVGTYKNPQPKSPPISSKSPVRLVASEHTSLLETDQRLFIEDSFKNGHQPWDVNLLSATPTMEMGIDIGDLSSVLLCSVPPAQANYLQRIGRAGRKDGNALNVTVANATPHDLYFYAEPMEMMAGDIMPPGVFLQATAVLERQFIAYCFDRWVQTDIDEKAIPARLKAVLDGIANNDDSRFPHNLIKFIGSQRSQLLQRFRSMFPELNDEGAEHLQRFVFGETDAATGEIDINHRLLNRLQAVQRQRESLQRQVKELKNKLDQLELQPQDEVTRETFEAVQQERTGLMQLLQSLHSKQTLNFFTDEGLLPNYAFPEEGVTLHSVIYRRTLQVEAASTANEESTEKSSYEKLSFEFQRPAQSALSELAPESKFYGVGRQVEVDQIDLAVSTSEKWRLCNHCHYAENLAEGDHHQQCPRCHSELWANISQKQNLLKLKQVFANSSDRESRISDEKDQREPIFFNRQLLVDIKPGTSQSAYRIDDDALPFGFEYLSQANFREVNFGKQGDAGMEIEVAGTASRRPGFQLCKHCGKVKKYRRNPRQHHSFSCKLSKPGAVASEDDYFDALYLYRELQSEAIRLLLPLAEVATSDKQMHSLNAALHLGLKKFFNGDVSHLQMTSYSEPLDSTGDQRRHYLVILDTIPGGTGYLKELLRTPQQLFEMLEKAHDTLANCACNHDSEKDGCYRCLFAYRESRNLKDISRDSAKNLLSKILALRDELVEVEGLEKVPMNALYESAFEERFVQQLGNSPGIALSPITLKTKPCFEISVNSGAEITRWHLEPQVKLGPVDDVHLQCKPDFVLWPLNEDKQLKPVAVFVDGFQFHADKMADDTQKRLAVLRSGKFYVWSLSWQDLPDPGKSEETLDQESVVDWMTIAQNKDKSVLELFEKIAAQNEKPHFNQLSPLVKKGPFAWLLEYLAAGSAPDRDLSWLALSRQFTAIEFSSLKDPERKAELELSLLSTSPALWQQQHVQGANVLGSVTLVDSPVFKMHVAIPQQSLSKLDSLASDAAVCLYLDDRDTSHEDFKLAWRKFWAASNLFQFLPSSCAVSQSGLEGSIYGDILLASLSDSSDSDTSGMSQAWEEALEFTIFSEQLHELFELGCPVPEPAFDWCDADGEVLGEIEWPWVDQKIAFIHEAPVFAGTLTKAGWRVITTLTSVDINRLANWLIEDQKGIQS